MEWMEQFFSFVEIVFLTMLQKTGNGTLEIS